MESGLEGYREKGDRQERRDTVHDIRDAGQERSSTRRLQDRRDS